ncbi:hypothetical protein UFOVP276_184 [uncultured Caudovirales phage]|uniref:Uncharacterized protein n=1 Tax=uncultured Caudovirales phage TaxID=2100421 RepID=A0A6J5LKV4_9CAUD|nr:hypothetical protein UFOVP127_78 [uncultured Caudovirales phage]CAB4135228.1 hypothetical protein UFOVP276_184 [uncultured Caudovirales phage]
MSNTLAQKKKAKENILEGADLWQVGFAYDALALIPWMSGLVKIRDIYCNDYGIFFIISSLDKTDCLCISGTLRGSPLNSVRLPRQALCVSVTSSEASTSRPYQYRPVDC